MADLVFDNADIPISTDRVVVHADEQFSLQWVPRNIGSVDLPAFVDQLVIESLPEGCPGSDDIDHEVIIDVDVKEPELLAGEAGGVAEHSIGPLASGAYRVRVTLASDLGVGATTAICINVVDPI